MLPRLTCLPGLTPPPLEAAPLAYPGPTTSSTSTPEQLFSFSHKQVFFITSLAGLGGGYLIEITVLRHSKLRNKALSNRLVLRIFHEILIQKFEPSK